MSLLGLVGACDDPRAPEDRVASFCSEIEQGESMDEVLARYPKSGVQPGGFAPDPAERLGDDLAEDLEPTLTGVLAEPAGSPPRNRPVCAIYYSDALKGGDGRVLLAELKLDWPHRY